MTTIVLESLPVELLHRIFDHLDAETLLIAVQYVSKRLNLVTNNYNRFILDFKSIGKEKFHRFARSTDPNHVISLTLSDENQTCGQIGLFLSLYPIDNYTRLQSLTLRGIEEPYLRILLQHASMHCSLTSLSIQSELHSEFNVESIRSISTIIGKNQFRTLDLSVGYETIDVLEWPNECSIRSFRLADTIPFNKFCTILRCSPYLQTMNLRDCIVENIGELNCALGDNTSYSQLTSLTLEDCDLEMSTIESLLSLTPALVHLIIKGNSGQFFDGARWERLFQMKLPNLTKFEFAFQNNIGMQCDAADFEAIMAPFQSQFWLEIKRWFISAVGVKKSPYINLYSIPDCAPKISFHPRANKISRSTVPSTMGDLITMNSVRELTLNLNEMEADIIEKNELPMYQLFNRLTKLIIGLDGDWPSCSLELLSALIDLSTITELELSIDFNKGDAVKTIAGTVALLNRMTNVRTLTIPSRTAAVQTICSIVSYPVQHLQIPINTVDEMKMILKRFDYLSSVTFKFAANAVNSMADIVEWLMTIPRDFTYQSTKYSLSLWLGKPKHIS